jgi:uncharacterized protein YjcR
MRNKFANHCYYSHKVRGYQIKCTTFVKKKKNFRDTVPQIIYSAIEPTRSINFLSAININWLSWIEKKVKKVHADDEYRYSVEST